VFPDFTFEGLQSGACFGAFFAHAFTFANHDILPSDGAAEAAVVRGAILTDDFVNRGFGRDFLKDLLECSLGISSGFAGVEGFDFRVEELEDDALSGF